MRVLITGGSGMIARKVAGALNAAGHTAYSLSRSRVTDAAFSGSFLWDPEKGTFDAAALRDMDAIVHLAGAGIADKRWTPERKREILHSRTISTAFLREQLQRVPNKIRSVVAASATGFYGDSGEEWMHESHVAGNGFLADTCDAWETSLKELASTAIRLTILRIGFVIDREDGALPVLARPVRWMAGAPYGSGRQFISWIDSSDLARIFVYALTDASMSGIYNAVAPSPVTNKEFVRSIGSVLHRPVWPVSIPSFVFKTMLGEQSELILAGQRVSSGKLQSAGFSFQYSSLEASLKHHLL